MAAPIRDTGAPDPGTTGGWAAEITASKDNHLASLMEALASGNAADWDCALTWTSGKLTQIVWTYQQDTSVKFKVDYTYSGDNLNTETWSFDKGLGAGYETPTGGTFTYGYTSGELTSITSS